jgi:hypothetical protein
VVYHNILIDHLAVRFGIRGLSLAWFQSYLSSRCQSISVSGNTSSLVYLPLVFPKALFLDLFYTICTPVQFMTYLPGTVLMIISMPTMIRNILDSG